MLANLLLFLGSCAILYYVLRYRVHVHINITNSRRLGEARSRGGLRSGSPSRALPGRAHETATVHDIQEPTQDRAATRRSDRGKASIPLPSLINQPTRPDQSVTDIASALENLGAKKHRARAAAQHVVRNWPNAGFDVQFREALKEVQAA